MMHQGIFLPVLSDRIMHAIASPRSILVPALLAAACVAPPALAQTAEPSWLGKPSCRIAPLEPAPRSGAVNWKAGDCVDGYASGKGMLAWRSAEGAEYSIEATLVRGEASGEAILKTPGYTYTGTLKNGVPHGQGFFEYANAKGWYEGEVQAGKPHGKGIALAFNRSRYTGEWVAGERNGAGEETFATGGSYTGQWKDDQFNGQGKIVYAGSGRVYEGLFKDGRVAGLPEMEVEKGRYSIHNTAPGMSFGQHRVIAYLPASAGWDQLTPAQKNAMRENFPALEAGDDPPFPAEGEGGLFKAVQRINNRNPVEGDLGVYILVGKEGKPLRVTTYGGSSQKTVSALSDLFMQQQFKPAVCRGAPCEMIYPIHFSFSVTN